MNIKLYNNASDNNVVHKNITQIGSDISGVWKENTSMLAPVIIINKVDTTNVNYVYVADFGRYYYITDYTLMTGQRIALRLSVDVLMSWKQYYLPLEAVIARQENQWNLYLNDEMFKAYQNPLIQCKKFPYGFTTQEFVLAVAGGN